MNKNDEKERINYLAIAITTNCNHNCFYCKPTGENINPNLKGTINFENLKKIIKVAYKLGITTFRITGGEPTMVEYLPSLIKYIMNLSTNTRIRLNTNGYKLNENELLDIIQDYKDRIDVVISVDSLNEYIHEIHYPKYLSNEIKEVTRELIKRNVQTRFNIVVTKQNIQEMEGLIAKSLSLGVNIKILDLIIWDEYFGTDDRLTGQEAIKFGKKSYISLESVTSYLDKISDKSKSEYYIYNPFGIPRSGYFIGNQWVQVKDTSKGTKYSRLCIKECPYYKTCNEGLFSPFISVGEILHLSGCKNPKLYYDLKGKNEKEMENTFVKILNLFEDTELRKN